MPLFSPFIQAILQKFESMHLVEAYRDFRIVQTILDGWLTLSLVEPEDRVERLEGMISGSDALPTVLFGGAEKKSLLLNKFMKEYLKVREIFFNTLCRFSLFFQFAVEFVSI